MQAPPFNTYLGIRVERKQAGTASASLDLAAQHLNRRGVAHGGVVSALLDSALGAAVISAMPQEWWCATTSLSCQFIEGAGTGCLTATGSVLRRGRKIAFAAGEVRDDRNRLIATAQGTWHLWPHRPGVREASPPVGTVVLRETGESAPPSGAGASDVDSSEPSSSSRSRSSSTNVSIMGSAPRRNSALIRSR